MIVQEEDPWFVQQKSALSRDKPNDPIRVVELNLIARGYKPAGPYGKFFWVIHRRTAEKFQFDMPRKDGRIDVNWLTALKDKYYELFPEDKAPSYNTPSSGVTNQRSTASNKTRCQCGYEWPCSSRKRRVSCPSCFTTVTRFKPEKPPMQEQSVSTGNNSPESKYPDIIITSDIDDLWLDGAHGVVIPGYNIPFFKGKRRRDVPEGKLIDPKSLIKKVEPKQEEKKPTLDDINKRLDIQEKLERIEQNRKPKDLADALINGTQEEFEEALIRAKLNKITSGSK